MNDPFGLVYARGYDALYKDKDYEGECDILLELLRETDDRQIGRILDLGCGTGSHAVILAERGIEVVGVDRSPEMIEIARQKTDGILRDRRPEFLIADLRKVRLECKFDAVIMMFAVLGYQHTNADVVDALATARAHLDVGGRLAFDVWYGPAVLSQRPADRIAIVDIADRRILRVASGSLDLRNHLCNVDYRVWAFERGRLVDETQESHAVRYFFPLELELLLEAAGFSLRRLGGFPEFTSDPSESTWNVLALAGAQ